MKLLYPNTAWVVKEDRGLGGQGIQITFDVKEEDFTDGKRLVQRYIEPPLLIQGKRFDVRVYVVVLSFSPLRVWMGKEGIVHLCADRYTSPSADGEVGPMSMHVTNHFINSKAKGYTSGSKDGSTGNNRSFENLNKHFPGDTEDLWRAIRVIVLKSLAGVKPFVDAGLERGFEDFEKKKRVRCYEVFGYDLIISGEPELRPYLLEVNQFPSWMVSGAWYAQIKSRLLRDVLNFCRVLHHYPPPASECPEASTSFLNQVENKAIKNSETPLLERIWPVQTSRSWATPDDIAAVTSAITLSNVVFSPHAATLPTNTTAALSPDSPITSYTEVEGPQVLSFDTE
eukprot:TRINITY_DN3490_c1_g1_i2.p1 TRINITY_DN3490_c1_g1~~TRINITY_DN3490_c1_g1_i2.p1  ORF type:complete len:341 (+),score=55.12 TRINITY_DN3490_c1_g1_i2:88-1110(+)